MKPFPLASTFVVVDPALSCSPIEVGPTLYQELDGRFSGFRQCLLVAEYSFDRDWPTWEMHPAGDEILYLLEGAAELQLRKGGEARVVPFDRPGASVIIPKGTWHTARIARQARILFLTPGEGTVHAVEPDLQA
jgi:mannose-6-phosphate isomerase-like protein (cupin superfamily)